MPIGKMFLLKRIEGRPEVTLYAALGALWILVARVLVPPIIAAAYEGRSLSVLNRFFRGRAPHPVEHYLGLWDAFSGAVLIAGALHLAVVLVVGRPASRHREASPLDIGAARRFIAFAFAFLAATLLSGPRHDYVADMEIWDAVLGGLDPWWLMPGRGYPLNAYGPLFNVLAALAWVNPMAPKLLFASAYLAFVLWLIADVGGGELSRSGLIAWFLNPFPWVEIAWFGHFDVLVAVACVAAVHARARGRDAASGAILGAGILLKYIPVVILPFLALDGRKPRPRLLLSAVLLVALGLVLSVLIWGPSTFRPLTFAATRSSSLLSIFRFLRGVYSPLAYLGSLTDVDFLALPCLVVAGGSIFAWCWWRRVDPATSALLAVLTTLLFYRVGFIQYQMVPFLLASYWAMSPRDRSRPTPFLSASLAIYFGWLALFDVYYASFGGVVHPGDPWAWVEEVVGLPTFLSGLALLIALLRHSMGPAGGASGDEARHTGRTPPRGSRTI